MSKKGYFGKFGGQFVTELLYPALLELEKEFAKIKRHEKFQKEFKDHPLRRIKNSLLDFKKQLSKVELLPIDL